MHLFVHHKISSNSQVNVFHENDIMLLYFPEDGFTTEIIKEAKYISHENLSSDPQ